MVGYQYWYNRQIDWDHDLARCFLPSPSSSRLSLAGRTCETDSNPACQKMATATCTKYAKAVILRDGKTLPQHDAHLQVSPVDDRTSSCGVRSSGDQPSNNDLMQGYGVVTINIWKCFMLFLTPPLLFRAGHARLAKFHASTRERRDLPSGSFSGVITVAGGTMTFG